MSIEEGSCEHVAEFLAALSHPKRVKVLALLREGPKTVVELAKGIELSQSATSQHLQILRKFGIVSVTRVGNQNYYSIADLRVLQLCGLAQKIVSDRARELSEKVATVKFGS
ncbi:MAG: metalloregulator ArsR/SmtB family transcription factor [Thaumarchaeota archaeon]|nr:metalloregulator ArsR/SmtB family transcription factor [Candidatus Calditenuaceae archaeon]MDW8187248.1 metalloregulator ArsR/SmtB family transcription factor [Nitrososphaerota archaeon]